MRLEAGIVGRQLVAGWVEVGEQRLFVIDAWFVEGAGICGLDRMTCFALGIDWSTEGVAVVHSLAVTVAGRYWIVYVPFFDIVHDAVVAVLAFVPLSRWFVAVMQ